MSFTDEPFKADLHIHTTRSDGLYSPEEIFKKAKERGIKAISVTDHDTIAACEEAFSLAEKYGLDYITGVEISCAGTSSEYHILGYGIDPDNKELNKHLDEFKLERYKRAARILERLKKIGFSLQMSLVEDIAGDAPIIRPHIAKAMIKMGYVEDIKDAFANYIGDWKAAYYPKKKYDVEDAIKLINGAGGIASLAHPSAYSSQKDVFKFINLGLDAIETVHPSRDENLSIYYKKIAEQYWLYETGGSDYHGGREFDEENFGKYYLTESKYASLKRHIFETI